jgi:hypothetical protein
MKASQKTKALTSATRGAEWLLSHLQADGSITGGSDLRAYYKTPFALIASGHVTQAEQVLDYVEQRYLLASGDLDGAGVPWFSIYRTYPHSWLCCAAVMRGRFGLARQLADRIATFHNPASDGFFADEACTIDEIMTTSMAGLASLWAGRLELACGAGRWLRNLLAAQPDLHRGLYTSWRNGLVTEFSEADAAGYFVDGGKTRQYYFQYGIAAALMSSLSGATGEAHWLDTARAFLQASAYAAEDRYQTPQSGKIGWGAAWTYRLSQRDEDRDLVHAVIDGLGALQNDDGSWLATGVYGGARAEADSVVIDVTSEFVALQASMGLVKGV